MIIVWCISGEVWCPSLDLDNLSGAVLSFPTYLGRILAFFATISNCTLGSWEQLHAFFHHSLFISCKLQRANKEKGDLGQTHHPIQSPFKELSSLFTRNTSFLGGGFTDSDESDSYAGDLPDGPGDLFTRVRRFQGSTGPPSGGPGGFQAGPPRGLEQGPPRGRPGFMFPPPPAGPPPEPGDLYSVLQCKEFNITTKKHKSGILLKFGL